MSRTRPHPARAGHLAGLPALLPPLFFLRRLIIATLGLASVPAFALAGTPGANTGTAGTLEQVKERGSVRCGITEEGRGLSMLDQTGKWVGFFPDFCRAVAAAVTGSAENVEFVYVSVGNRFDALRDGAVDLLSEPSTWTLSRDIGLHLTFVGLYFFDGQGFMVHRSTGAQHLSDLREATVCVQTNTTSLDNLNDFSASHDMRFKLMKFDTVEGSYSAFFNRQCQAITDDTSSLSAIRLTQAPDPASYPLLSELISKEPLGPAVRDDDVMWADVVRWILFAIIAAEELGVHSGNVDRQRDGANAEIRRLLGQDPTTAEYLRLPHQWAYAAIKQVGNYGEIFERNLGQSSPLKLERGINKLWRQGGLLWAPPVR